MAITVVAGSAVGSSSSTSIAKPTTAGYTETANDLILVQCESSAQTGSNVPALPTGFTSLGTNVVANNTATIWGYKLDSGSETWPKSWTAAAGSSFSVWSCIILRGQDTSTPTDGTATSGQTGSSGGTISLGAITATVSGDTLVIMGNDANDVDVTTWPTGVTEYAPASNPTGNGVMTGTKASMASGTTGTLSVVFPNTAGFCQAMALLVKAPSAGGTAWTQSLSDKQSALDTRWSGPNKNLPLDTFSETDTSWRGPNKVEQDTTSALDTSWRGPNSMQRDTTSALDLSWRGPGKGLQETTSATDGQTHGPGKNLSEGTSALDSQTKATRKLLPDSFSQTDALSKLSAKTLIEFISQTDSRGTLKGTAWFQSLVDKFSELDTVSAVKPSGSAWSQLLSDKTSALDVLTKGVVKLNADQFSQLDTFLRVWTAIRTLQEVLSGTDTLAKGVGHTFSDTLSAVDLAAKLTNHMLSNTTSAQDSTSFGTLKALGEAFSATDVQAKAVIKPLFEQLSQQDQMVVARVLLLHILDAFSQTDAQLFGQNIPQAPTLSLLAMALSLVSGALGMSVSLQNMVGLAMLVSLLSATMGMTTSLQLAPPLAMLFSLLPTSLLETIGFV